MGQIVTVKMNILVEVLFLFSTLPIKIPIRAFNMLQSLIMKFIWEKKRPVVKMYHLTKEK